MRELAIGDIHGCAQAFAALLAEVRPQPEDTLVLLGDYIDRGPDSCGVLELILDLRKRCHVVALIGNHEKMMLRTRDEPETAHTWLSLGGLATLDSYALHGFRGGISAIPQSHWQFLEEQTVAYWETEREIFVHATLDPELDMAAQPDFLLFWERFSSPTVHKSGKQIVCGHTSQRSGLPAVFEGGVCIDTWVYGPGWLTCFDITGRTFTQANQRGQLRTLDLARLNAP